METPKEMTSREETASIDSHRWAGTREDFCDGYESMCSCGWKSNSRLTSGRAFVDWTQHVTSHLSKNTQTLARELFGGSD